MLATRKGHGEVVSALLQAGANVNIKNKSVVVQAHALIL